MPELLRARSGEADAHRKRMEGVCFGFAPGSSSLTAELGSTDRVQVVTSLVHPDEPSGWHPFPESPEMSMRRARRIDVWVDGDVIRVDSSFQDSSGDPEYGRVAVHEYGLTATIDRRRPGPSRRWRPTPACCRSWNVRTRSTTSGSWSGSRSGSCAPRVPELLGKTMGCTHLNDALPRPLRGAGARRCTRRPRLTRVRYRGATALACCALVTATVTLVAPADAREQRPATPATTAPGHPARIVVRVGAAAQRGRLLGRVHRARQRGARVGSPATAGSRCGSGPGGSCGSSVTRWSGPVRRMAHWRRGGRCRTTLSSSSSDACLRPLVGSAGGTRASYIATPGADDWVWPSGVYVRDGVIHVMLLRLLSTPGPVGFAFTVTGAAATTLSGDDFAVGPIVDLPGPPCLAARRHRHLRRVAVRVGRRRVRVRHPLRAAPTSPAPGARPFRAAPGAAWDGRALEPRPHERPAAARGRHRHGSGHQRLVGPRTARDAWTTVDGRVDVDRPRPGVAMDRRPTRRARGAPRAPSAPPWCRRRPVSPTARTSSTCPARGRCSSTASTTAHRGARNRPVALRPRVRRAHVHQATSDADRHEAARGSG